VKLTALVLACSVAVAAADVRLPAYTRKVLPNGIVLDVIPRSEVPLVSFRVLIRGGVESDPVELPGLAEITAEALRRGTAKRTASQFSEELDALGATLTATVDMQSTGIGAEFLAKDFQKGLELLYDTVMSPAFPEAEVAKVLKQSSDALRSVKDNPRVAVAEYFRNFYFGSKHPYGRPADETTVARINRAAIVDYHKKMYTGRNLILVVAGDIDAARASEAVSKVFGAVPAGSAWQWQKAETPKPAGARMAIVHKADATETQFRIGLPGLDRADPDRVPLWVVNTFLGGRFTSLLNEALRVNSGLSYGANSTFDQDHLQGRITVSTFTSTDNTVKGIDMALDVLKKYAESGLNAEQLASTKAYIKGTYPADRLETADQIATAVGTIELFNLNKGDVDDLFSRIDAVTVEQANQTIRKYLKPENLTFLLLGNADEMPADVRKYAAKPVRISVSDPGLRVIQ